MFVWGRPCRDGRPREPALRSRGTERPCPTLLLFRESSSAKMLGRFRAHIRIQVEAIQRRRHLRLRRQAAPAEETALYPQF